MPTRGAANAATATKKPPIQAYHGTCFKAGENSLPCVAATTAPSASDPTMKEMNAATIGEPDAFPSSALVGAWTAISTPAMIARPSDNVAPFILFPPVEQIP